MLFEMTMEEALKCNLLVCKHCGWPPNNHFNYPPRKCAHDEDCPGFKADARYGKLLTTQRKL